MTRLHGIDLARALAILGMVFAHVGPANYFGDALTRGYASATFAVLAGVSLSIISSSYRLMVRGVLLMVIGCLLQLAQSSIAVVLVAIGIIFVLLPPVLRWRSRWVAALCGGFMLIGPGVQVVSEWNGTYTEVLGMPYPAIAWLTYVTLGILIHRHLVHSAALQGIVLVLGTAIGAAGVVVRDVFAEAIWIPKLVSVYFSPEPHQGGLLDVACSCGAASAAIAGCLLLVQMFYRPLYPLRALGAMSLTFYVCHVLTAGPIMDHSVSEPVSVEPMAKNWEKFQTIVRSAETYSEFAAEEQEFYAQTVPESALEETDHTPIFWYTLAAGLVCAPLWLWFFRRGPLEWVMHRLIERAERDRF